MRRRALGMTMIELLIGLVIMSVMLLALYSLFGAQAAVQSVVLDENSASRDARNPLDTLADHLRSAQLCDASLACGYTANSVIDAATASDITYYVYSGGTWSKVRYYLSGTTLNRVAGGTTVATLQNVNSLTLAYYTNSTYNSTNLTATASPNAPTAAELLKLAAIRITASTTTDGRTVQYSTLVRLSNSPLKPNTVDGLKGN